MPFKRFHDIPGREQAQANPSIDNDPFNVHWRIYRLCHTEKNTDEANCLTLPEDVTSAVQYLIAQIKSLDCRVCNENGASPCHPPWVPLWVKYTALATLASTMLRWLSEFPSSRHDTVNNRRERLVWMHSRGGTFTKSVEVVVSDPHFLQIVTSTELVIKKIVACWPQDDLCRKTFKWLQTSDAKVLAASCPDASATEDTKQGAYLEGRFIVVFAAIVCLLARSKLEREALRGNDDEAVKKKALADKTNFALKRYYVQLRAAAGAQPYDSYIHIENFFPKAQGGHFMHLPWRQEDMHKWIAQLGDYVVKLTEKLTKNAGENAVVTQVFDYPAVRLFSTLHLRHRERQYALTLTKSDVAVSRRRAIESTIERLESSGRLCAAAALGAHYCHIARELLPNKRDAEQTPVHPEGGEGIDRTNGVAAPFCASQGEKKLLVPSSLREKAKTAITANVTKFARMARRCGYVVPEAANAAVAQDQPVCETPEELPFDALCTNLLETQDIRALMAQINDILELGAEVVSISDKRQHILSADFVDRLAALLTEAFDLPFHADEDLRMVWQKTVLKLMASFDVNSLHALPVDTLLRLHAIAAHGRATAQRGLEWHERHMFASVDSVTASVVARRRAVTAASESEVIAALTLYAKRRTFGNTSAVAYLQVLLLSDAVVQVFACGLRDGKLTTALHRVTFTATTAGEYAPLKNWRQAVKAFAPIIPNTNEVFKPTETVLGTHQSFIELKQAITKAAKCVAWDAVRDLLISPDPEIAKIPWQYFFTEVNGTNAANINFLVCHIPSIKWLHNTLTEHYRQIARGWTPRYHQCGVSGWMANTGTPSPANDLRGQVANCFGANSCNLRRPTAYQSTSGLSLSYVFAHGQIVDSDVVRAEAMGTDETEAEREWDAVADHRIVLLLSCHTAHGVQGHLRDYVGLPTRLLERAKAVIAPPYEVPSDVAVTLAAHVGECIRSAADSDKARSIPVGLAYIDAIEKNWRVSLFSLWGMSSEFIRWLPRDHRPEYG